MTGLVASFMLTRYFVSGGQDMVSVHVYTRTIKRKLLLACGQAGMKAAFTHSHRRDICLTKVKLNPDPSAASGTKKLRRNRLCGMCRGWDTGCAGVGCMGCAEAGYRGCAEAGVRGAEPQVPTFGEPGTHADVAVRVKHTE